MSNLRGLRVARIHGVDLKIHVSLLFLLFYIVVVAGAQFPAVVKQSGLDASSLSGGPFVWGFLFAIGLFASVALHEFGHVFMAQALGVKVRGVTLMMLGGVSEMESVPETRFAELKLSIVGPLVSLALGFGLLGLRILTSSADLSLFCYWLGRINVVLGVFNLLPAFPMDGGRALRSVLAAKVGMLRATQTAVATSKILAWTLGILGLFSVNFLLMLIAFFIYTTASTELYLLVGRDLLRNVKAAEVMTRLSIIDESASLQEAAEEMLRTRNRVLPVHTSTGTPAIVSLVELRGIPRERWGEVRVAQVMERPEYSLDVGDSLGQSLTQLAGSESGVIPVKEQGQVIGVIRSADLAETLQFKSMEANNKKKAA